MRALRQNLPDFVVAMQDRPHEAVLWRSRRLQRGFSKNLWQPHGWFHRRGTGYDRGDQTIDRADAHIIVCAIQAQNRIGFVIAEELCVMPQPCWFPPHARLSNSTPS